MTINLVEMGLYGAPPRYDDIRIAGLGVYQIEAHVVGNPVQSANCMLWMKHSGVSRLSKDGQEYLFRHYNPATENPIWWGATYDALLHVLSPISPSPAAMSLLCALLGDDCQDANLLLFSEPAAWADIVITKEVDADTSGVDVVIDSLWLVVTNDFRLRRWDVVTLEVLVSESVLSDLTPYFRVDTLDRTSKKDGRGSFHRSYSKGQEVTVTAPEWLGYYKFNKWTDRFGGDWGGVCV